MIPKMMKGCEHGRCVVGDCELPTVTVKLLEITANTASTTSMFQPLTESSKETQVEIGA